MKVINSDGPFVPDKEIIERMSHLSPESRALVNQQMYNLSSAVGAVVADYITIDDLFLHVMRGMISIAENNTRAH